MRAPPPRGCRPFGGARGAPALPLVLALLALAGCGAGVRMNSPGAAALARAFAAAPPRLAAVHGQANQILSGVPAAFAARLRSLRGFPVVVDKWASWCGPCQIEFPIFQRVAPRFATTIAFLGDDVGDVRGDARHWLTRHPVSYPSFWDPRYALAMAIDPATEQYSPVTYFYSARGRRVYVHFGLLPLRRRAAG